MRLIFLFSLLLTTSLGTAQSYSISTCNSMDTEAEREACIAAYVDQLVVQRLLAEDVSLITQQPGALDFTISVDPKTRIVSVAGVKASNPFFEQALREEVAKIFPLAKDKKWRKIIFCGFFSFSVFKRRLLPRLQELPFWR